MAKRDSWDASNDGKLWKILKCTIANANKSERDAQDANNNFEIIAGQEQDTQQDIHVVDEIKLRTLEDFCNREFVAKLEKAQRLHLDQQFELETMRILKVRTKGSIETKMLSVLKEIVVELGSYHEESMVRTLKKVMNNACHIFDSLLTIFNGGKRPNCVLLDANIDTLCLQFREVFILWDGFFFISKNKQSNKSRHKNLSIVC